MSLGKSKIRPKKKRGKVYFMPFLCRFFLNSRLNLCTKHEQFLDHGAIAPLMMFWDCLGSNFESEMYLWGDAILLTKITYIMYMYTLDSPCTCVWLFITLYVFQLGYNFVTAISALMLHVNVYYYSAYSDNCLLLFRLMLHDICISIGVNIVNISKLVGIAVLHKLVYPR